MGITTTLDACTFGFMQEKLREHIEKIIPLTDDEFALVFTHFTFKKFKKHQFLIQEGDAVKYSYFVISGLLKLVYTDNTEKQHIVSFAMEDWWESDFYAFYTQTKATMSLECLEDTEVFCLSFEDYQKLRNALQKMERFFLEKSNFGFLGAQRRIISLITSNAKERYEQLLQQYPSLIQRVPKSLLAAYLGVSRETLSRLSS
ncbi:cAMP-binding domain of CRP or a regulatory subunit of cAMP-dependent protein kinases [Chitinophaga sp. CF418]|nr:cAMP-binding domain of CRP or a regulatory subunit of cAMP-dependent protein kinases [Chitinophaga sp. CF418]